MSDDHSSQRGKGVSRRTFLQAAGAGVLSLGVGEDTLGGRSAAAATTKPGSRQQGGASSRPYNILFILTDQERYIDPADYPPGYTLPARERLQRRGVTFTSHYINSAVCTPSRSVIYTGQHIQHTRMFDNNGFPWIESLSPEIPTLGGMLNEAGYYAAYKGKWHLSDELGTRDEFAHPQEELAEVLERYAFRDYVGIGDIIGETHGGYLNDHMIAAQARRWLRLKGQPMSRQAKPWFLAVNLVNPHDVMFYDTDEPGQQIHGVPEPLMRVDREPDSLLYRQQWDVRLPASRREPFDKTGRPAAHKAYQLARAALVGSFPNEDGRWRRLLNYYHNCILHADRVTEGILKELDDLGLAEDTIVVMTSDHGELCGAHGTHGKGATCYREQNQVPLTIAHPGYPQTHGQSCAALTSHMDLAPSILSWTGMAPEKRTAISRDLRGKDVSPLLAKGAAAGRNDLRGATLYCFNMFLYLDSEFMRKFQAYLNSGGDMSKVAEQGFRPDFRNRGAIRSVYDGRYKFSRYFSPKEHNQPRTLEGIFALNDVELFDLDADPEEMQNLGVYPKKSGDLIMAMNQKMNDLIDTEVGVPDDGAFLPGEDANWAATRFDP